MSKKKSFRVYGTTCASCEVVIERNIKKLPGVESVHASHKKGRVNIRMEEGHTISTKDIEPILEEHGYSFESESESREAPSTEVDWFRIFGSIAAIIVTYFILDATGFLRLSPGVESSSSFVGIFIIGLVAAFSSCTAVLSGLIAAVSASIAKQGDHLTRAQRMRPHYLFNAGRLAGFIGFGALIGFLGSAIQLSVTANGFFVLIIALLMIGLGINLLEVIPNGVRVFTPPKWLSHKIHDLSSSHKPTVPFTLGALTFFLPCGFTQAMQLFALSTGDPRASAMIMGVFALGTIPALLGIGAITSSAKGASLKKMTFAAGIIVIVLGISNVSNGFAILDIGSVFTSSAQAGAPTSIVEGAEQVVKMDVTEYGTYQPSTLTVTEGVPVRWEITGGEFLGCANTLVMRAFGVNERIQTGKNIVKFTPTKTGSFTFSCSMGMIRGTMNVIPSNS